MSRRNDRKHIFQLVFQLEFHDKDEIKDCLELYLENFEISDEIDRDFIEMEFKGVIENLEKIDELINKYSEGWSVSRISKTDIAIIRLCVYEILFNEQIPQSVAINEAVELAKIYSSDEAPSFINGLLATIVSNV